jgi:uncharacterized protein (UPF0335 family)
MKIVKIVKIASKINKSIENSITEPFKRSLPYGIPVEVEPIEERKSFNLRNDLVKEAAKDPEVQKLDKVVKEMEKEFKDLRKDIKKVLKEVDSLNIGQRRFWQQSTVFTSLQRKIERFEKIEQEWKKYKKEMDKKLKMVVERRSRAQI